MSIKDIQVHIDNDAACSKRVKMAVNLAATMNAHLTGVHVRRSFPFPEYSMVPTSADVIKVYDDILNDQESKARAVFDESIAQDNTKTSWQSLIGSLSYHLANEAHYADLLVIGQPNSEDLSSLESGIANEIIMSAGRPCLLVPHHGDSVSFGESPLVAWDGSREASRAVHDALPFLKQAGKATIIIVEPERADPNFGDLPGTVISEHLARHDINVKVEVSRGSLQSTGDTILSYADAYGHDLVVMGAYGHSRLREIVLGGATRNIMKQATIPVLMSH